MTFSYMQISVTDSAAIKKNKKNQYLSAISYLG